MAVGAEPRAVRGARRADASRPHSRRCRLADRVAVEHAIRDFTLSGVALERRGARAVQRDLGRAVGAVDRVRQRGARRDRGVERARHRRGACWRASSEADQAMFAAAAQGEGAGRLAGHAAAAERQRGADLRRGSRPARARLSRVRRRARRTRGRTRASSTTAPRIARILALRHEAAELLGFADPVALVAGDQDGAQCAAR